jgi:LysM repeat protein
VVSYRVKRGETLSHIARRHRVSVATLRRMNGLRRSSLLRIGQVIKVPVPNRAT